jgi:predicted NAD-dependent protein-ADP-ribosyltransferase YbiA (DUF1768 family)
MELECEADEGPVFFFESDESNGFLSQAFLSAIEAVDVKFNCSEQFFQAIKAKMFSDNDELYKAIMSATDPREQKALGKHIKTDDANMPSYWVRVGELSKHRIWYRRLIDSGSGISSYQGCNASEV